MDLYTLWIVIGIGLASNLDNAGVGIAYGVRRIQINTAANLIIASISAVATILGGLVGEFISLWIPLVLAHLIGTVVIVGVGIWVLCQPFFEKRSKKRAQNPNSVTQILRSPEVADRDQSLSISTSEAIMLGIALSMNAVAGGFNAGITNVPIIATALSVGICSFVLMLLCSTIGRKYAADKLGDHATIFSGLLLIFIGLHQIL